MKSFLIKTLILSTTLITFFSFGTIIKVPEDYPSIQQAIDASSNGDTVLVSPGIYYENINFNEKNILLTSYFLFDHDLSYILNTIINGSQPAHQDTGSCVLIISGEDSTAVLQGFTLTEGKGTRWQDVHIGGFYREGGGILMELSSPTIQFNLISNNEAVDRTNCVSAGGGAIRCGDGNPAIQNNIIINNSGRYGGGIVMNFATGTIRNNIIMNNSGGEDYGGSGIWSYAAGTTIIENNTIMYNHSTKQGGGIQIWSTSAVIKNNIIRNNNADLGGNQVFLISSPSTEVTYSNVEGGWTGEGNIDEEPYFEGTKFILSDSSSCIDAGDPDPAYNDPEGEPGMGRFPSKGTIRNDMGAYGGPRSAELSDFIITSIDNQEGEFVPQGFQLYQNYPNPFNPSTKITFSVTEASYIKLSVFNIIGEEVKTLLNENREAGQYTIDFNANGFSSRQGSVLSSGVYLYKIQAGDFVQVKKMILSK